MAKARQSSRRRRRTAAFTLIEMLAVVAIFALMASLVIPNLGTIRSRALHREAQRIGGQLELARQRAIVTGVPHRIWIDLDDASYRLEWLVSEDEARGEPTPAAPPSDPTGGALLSLAPPRAARRQYLPLTGLLGRDHALEDGLAIVGLETPEGWIGRGEAYIAFDRDGTTVYTGIVLEDESGRSVTLDVLPLADAVRIRDESQ
ncbi:MAG: prepilin-type N-terminal cleavage/methylation domain-containing protein [Myxococcales bacterium]|nr:prepilin-type N-terminal cleavage/methylation domain-containing protein [Myxococcales bacterium]